VLEVRRPGGPHAQPEDNAAWLVKTVYTDESLRHRHEPCWLEARHVILAAGTLGSTEILLRSQSFRLTFSQQLGEQFSCNGDNLVALHDGPDPVHTTSEESVPLRNRQVGPTITAMVDLDGMLVQEFAVPAALKRLFDETVTTARLFQDLGKPPERADARSDGCDSFQANPRAMENTLLLGLIGHDESCGQLQLSEPARMDDSRHLEGRVRIRWPGVRNSFMLDRAFDIARTLAQKSRGKDVPFLPNPAWRLLPDSMDFLVQGERGPVLTVHPLGGCPMGDTFQQGVVDDHGRVFDRAACEQALAAGETDGGTRVHHGLAVLDGSIIPASLGANPALMIATVARRAARLLATQWGFEPASAALKELRPRPVYRAPEHCTPGVPQPTEVQLTERLIGRAGDKLLELTLRYQPATVQDLMSARRPGLKVDPGPSRLRVYDCDPDTQRQLITWSEQTREERAELVATVSGELDMLRQRPGDALATVQALWHWFRNRGSRELWDSTIARTQPQTISAGQFWASGARAAEARLFDYRITVGALKKGSTGLLRPGDVIAGEKRLSYGLCSNPWRQLREMHLTQFPRTLGPGVLHLDCRFLARQGYPLLRITRQQNQVTALAELASWGAAWLRMLVSIHLWSFRAPDPAPVRTANLLPSPKRTRLPAPEISEIELEPPRRGVPVRMRLTRYRGEGRPIALIHGYSASGTTFTHDAIPKPLALHLLERGHDVWVLDLRTSAGMPSAILPWHFEDAALADLPLAFAHIRRVTNAPEVDVFAHCIGAVMLSMALLADPDDLSSFDHEAADGGARSPRRPHELAALRESLGGVVLSQKAPLLVYSDDNVLRAYFMRLLRQVLLPENYRFTVPTQQQGIAGGLLDRVLSTMPYPDDDFRRENPFLPPWKRAPWAGFRHRMDALYACDFKLANIDEGTLGAIQDLFGPLNLDAVAQAIHFARFNTVTDATGRAIDTQAANLRARWPGNGTLSLHGSENGLVDVATLDVFAAAMARAGVPLQVQAIPGYGHQDCLIGRQAQRDVFRHVSTFLGDPHDPHFRPRARVPVADRGPERQG
jgi:cholesterol oxidase